MAYQHGCMLLGLILVLNAICLRRVPGSFPYVRLGLRTLFFLCYSATLYLAGFSPWRAVGEVSSDAWLLTLMVLLILWWFLCASVLTDIVGALLRSRTGGGGRLLQEVVGAIIFLIATVAAAAYILELPVKGLIATSGALAIIIGLALQSTLGDLFSGIVLNATRPYNVGDWIQIEGMEGRVKDIDWRATLLQTAQGTTVIIPNSVAAKTKIQNLSNPEDQHGIQVSLYLPLIFRPERVQLILEQSLKGYTGLLKEPGPKVILKAIADGLLEYEINAFVRSSVEKIAARNKLYDLAYRHLRAAGIDAGQGIEIPAIAIPKAIIADVRVFASFSEVDKLRLAEHVTTREFAAGEALLKADDVSEYLLVIAMGVVAVQVISANGWMELARMGPSEVLGEQGILNDKPSGAQFVALTGVTVLQLHRHAVRLCMKESAALRASLSRLQIVRQEHAKSVLLQKPTVMSKHGFLEWLKVH